MDHSLADIEFQKVRELITERIALNFPIEGWGILRLRLISAAEEFGFHDLSVFVRWLLNSDLKNDQIQKLASHLTITETYFWREPQVFKALAEKILPEMIEAKRIGEKSIKIWSAGCSTGEEPYSLAMAVRRAIPVMDGWKITILATDINPKAIEKAKTGIYGSWSFRNTPDWLKTGYFKQLPDNRFEILPEIRNMVTFSSFNLAQENFHSTICKNEKVDIIFCRNVLMYFDKKWASRVSQSLFDSLKFNGFLVVSSCELSSDHNPQFTSVNFPGAILYRKDSEEFIPNNPVSPVAGNPFLSESAAISLKNEHIIIQPSENTETEFRKSTGKSNRNTFPGENIISSKISIRSMANEGHLEEAMLACNAEIESDKLARSLYFLKASILQEMDQKLDAIKTLKQAVFIDPDYIIGHFVLGNLFKELGNIRKSKKYHLNALELLDKISNDSTLQESYGFSVTYIREVILSNLQIETTI